MCLCLGAARDDGMSGDVGSEESTPRMDAISKLNQILLQIRAKIDTKALAVESFRWSRAQKINFNTKHFTL
jgi:hypothetical protein